MKTAEILAIGDELLRGIVAESNSHWLAKRIAARGASLLRVTVLPDRTDVVAAEVRAALARSPRLLVTHGGLGPTDDDRTREALAIALEAPAEPNPVAEEIVRRRYRELHALGAVADARDSDARMRMTLLPHGAQAFDNQIGTAPAFAIRHAATTIVALPGVPPELFWIWENELAPLLDELLGPGGFAEETLTLEHRDESSIAWLLSLVQERHPGVYVKSRARGFTEEDLLRVTLAAAGGSADEARSLVEAASRDVRAALRAERIPFRG